MMRSGQRGELRLSLLVLMALTFGSVYWLLSDYLPAQAEELQGVVSLAVASPEASAAVVAALKETPNPNRTELRRLRSSVNEIIVTETARRATGDKTLETPSARDAARERKAAARLAGLESKSWGEMSIEEQALLFASKSYIALIVLAFLGIAVVGWRTIFPSRT